MYSSDFLPQNSHPKERFLPSSVGCREEGEAWTGPPRDPASPGCCQRVINITGKIERSAAPLGMCGYHQVSQRDEEHIGFELFLGDGLVSYQPYHSRSSHSSKKKVLDR